MGVFELTNTNRYLFEYFTVTWADFGNDENIPANYNDRADLQCCLALQLTNKPTDTAKTDEMESLYWHTHGSLLWQL